MKKSPTATEHIFSRTAPAHAPSQASQAEREVALAHYTGGHWEQAEAHCRALTQRHPLDGFGWKVLGATLRQRNQAEASLEPMQIAAKLMPGDWEVFNNLGTTLDMLGHAHLAESCFEHALKLRPDFLEAWRNAAENWHHQGKSAQALHAHRQVCALAPEDGHARHMVDTLSGTLGERAP